MTQLRKTQLRNEPRALKVIDADTHFSEPHDLWTSRAPASWKDRVLQVKADRQGKPAWFINGDQLYQSATGASSVIRKDGSKRALWDWDIQEGMGIDEVSPACYDTVSRLEMMDRLGIWAQIVYPNLTGFSAHVLAKHADQELARVIISIYNDAMGEMQEASGGRLYPMALLPFWDMDAALVEVQRAAAECRLHGITMSSEPHSAGLPPITDHHWDPLWELCSELDLPINFHVASSKFGYEAYFKGVWPGFDEVRSLVIGAVQLEMHNARVLTNLLASDLLVRFPKTRWVSVESGIGWIPYVLERMEHQLLEQGLTGTTLEQPSPTELFRRQVYACFWFEDAAPRHLLDDIGFDNVLFETDFPHTTCLYPDGVAHGLEVLKEWGPEVQRKVMSENAARVYNIAL